MFCKSLLESAAAASRRRGIKPRVRQAILQLDLVLMLVIFFFGTRQIALGQGDPLHEHGFFRTSFGHL